MNTLLRLRRRATIGTLRHASWLVFLGFLCSTAVRTYLAQNVQSFRFINDEMLYWNMAHSLWQQGRLLYHGVPITFVNLLYPLFLAPLTGLGDVASAFMSSKLLGAALISSAVFPAWLLARKILQRHFWSLCIALVALLVPEMIFSALMLTEVVFYPLSLWFCYLVVRYLELEGRRARYLHLTGMALFALLLFLSKTSSIFLPLTFGLLLIVEAWLEGDLFWEGIRRIGIYGGLFVLAYLIYNLSFIIGNRLTTITTTELGTLVQYLTAPNQLTYLLQTVLLYLLIFTVNGFFFPILLPLVHFYDYPPQERKLVLFNFLAVLVGSVIIVLTVTLKEDYPDPLPRIHLRYLFPILFLWLPLGLKAMLNFKFLRQKAFWSIALFLLTCYLYLVTSFHALIEYDAPSRALLRWCKESTLDPTVSYAILRFGIVAVILLFGIFLARGRWRRTLSFLLLSGYITFSVVSGGILQAIVAPELTTYQLSLVAEAAAIGNYLQEHEGNILLLCVEPRGDAMLEPYLGRPYYLLWEGEREFHDYLWHEGERVNLEASPVPVHVQYSTYNQRPHVASIKYIIISGKSFQTQFKEESLRLIDLEPETSTYKLYEVLEPVFLDPQMTLSGPQTENKFVAEHRIRAQSSGAMMLLELDLELESAPEGEAISLSIEGSAAPIIVPVDKKRANYAQRVDLPEEATYFDLTIKVVNDDGNELNPLNHRLHSYSLRLIDPKY